jgi:hypothetical protein
VIKRNITYKNLDGVEVTEEWHFALDKAELIEIKTASGGVQGALQTIISGGDKNVITQAFRELIMQSVGKRQGQRFVKTQDIRDEFMQTGAYAALFMEILTNIALGIDFVMGIMPADLPQSLEMNDLRAQMAAAGLNSTDADKVLKQIQDRVQPMADIPALPMESLTMIQEPTPPEQEKKLEEPIYFAGKTKSQLVEMPIDELTDLIQNSAGNVPKELIIFAMQKRHQN